MNIQNLSEEQRAGEEHALALSRSTALATREPHPLPEPPPRPRPNPLMMLWRRRVLFLTTVAVCVLGAWVKYLLTPAVYRSEARLFVQTNTGNAAPAAPRSDPQSNLYAQAEMIKSTSVLAMVLASPELDGMKTFEVSRYRALKDNLSTTVGKENDLITVSFESPDPKEARQVLRKVIEAYAGFQNKQRQANLVVVEKWRAQTKQELEKKQQELLDFKRANSALSLGGEKGNLVVQKLDRLEQAVTDAHVETVNAKGTLDAARGMLDQPEKLRKFVDSLRASGMAASPSAEEQSLRNQLLTMENQLDDLRRHYLPDHPAVRAAQQTVASLRSRMGEYDRGLAEAYVLRLQQELGRAQNREKELQQNYDEQKKAAMELSTKIAEAEALDAEVKRLSAALEKADQKLIEASGTDNAGAPTIQVIDEPNLPSTPVRPLRNAVLFQGLLIGLLLGFAAAVVRDLTDQGLRSTDDVAAVLATPILGAVPRIPGPVNPMAAGRKVDLEPAGDVAETYRTIRTAVFFGTPDRESRTILVTSPARGEGRSTFASNLAIAMAQAGKKVLLLDADFRRPVHHRVFECRSGAGLSSVLTGGEPLDRAIQPSGVPGMDLLPAGPLPSNPAEILNGQLFTEILEELTVRYDHVVLDSPPVLAYADARILGAMCSVTILVLRLGTTTRKGAQHAKAALEAVGAQLLGVAVNDGPGNRDRDAESGGSTTYRRRHTPGESGGRGGAGIAAESFRDLRRK